MLNEGRGFGSNHVTSLMFDDVRAAASGTSQSVASWCSVKP